MSSSSEPERLSIPDQAKELLVQIDAVTTRGMPLMDKFFYVSTVDSIPDSIENMFSPVDNSTERVDFAFLFAHTIGENENLVEEGEAGMLTLSRHEYRGEALLFDSSAIFRVMISNGSYRLEGQIDYTGASKPIPIFDCDDIEAITAHENMLATEAKARQQAMEIERSLGMLGVSYAIAEDLIEFSRRLNPGIAQERGQ